MALLVRVHAAVQRISDVCEPVTRIQRQQIIDIKNPMPLGTGLFYVVELAGLYSAPSMALPLRAPGDTNSS